MAIATRTASIIDNINSSNAYADTTVTEIVRSANVPIHFTERIATDPEGQSVKRARIRIPSQYVVEPGDILLIDSQRWSVADIIAQRTPQKWHIVNCVQLVP